MHSALAEYTTIYLPYRNYAPKTRQDYTDDIRELAEFLDECYIRDVTQIHIIQLNSFMAKLEARGLSSSSRRRKTYAIKSFFDFLELHNHITFNVTRRLIPPLAEEYTPRVLREDEYKRFQLSVAHTPRDAALVELLLQTGIRLAELSKLTLNDVRLPTKITQDPSNVGELQVRQGKGRKDRVLALNYKACRALKTYLMIRPKVTSPFLFISKRQRGITPRGIEFVVAKHLEAAQVVGATVHTMRHTFGTHMMKNGAGIKSVQEMMGHANIQTTSGYISLAREMMNKDMQTHAL